jgi:predicted secreted protein
LRIHLLALLTILALSGCTPNVPVSATSTEIPGENTVTIIHATLEPVAKVVTLEATQNAEGSTPMEPEQGILELTETDSGRSVEITLGTSIVLHLKGQPSTGYTWVVDEVDSNILAQDGEPQYTAASNLRGAEETMVWKFKSIGAGTTALKLIYTRIFEKGQLPLKTFELVVKVSDR